MPQTDACDMHMVRLVLACSRFAWQSSLESSPGNLSARFAQHLLGLPSSPGEPDLSLVETLVGTPKNCI